MPKLAALSYYGAVSDHAIVYHAFRPFGENMAPIALCGRIPSGKWTECIHYQRQVGDTRACKRCQDILIETVSSPPDEIRWWTRKR